MLVSIKREWTGPARCQGKYCTCPACVLEDALQVQEMRREMTRKVWQRTEDGKLLLKVNPV